MKEVEQNSLTGEQERAELDAMVERLARSPRLANLLRYIGNHYFHGDLAHLREHNIAIEVFGRSSNFNPSDDAIARVEAHRLRKKLKQYYALEGRDSAVTISLPAGTYVPVFSLREHVEPPQETAIPELDRAKRSVPFQIPGPEILQGTATLPPFSELRPVVSSPPGIRIRKSSRQRWLAIVSVCFLSMAVVTAVWMFKRRTPQAAPQRTETAVTASPVAIPVLGSNDRAVRILAGYSGQAHLGPSGAVWGPDRYFQSGGPWRGAPGFTARTNDPFLFQSVRTGDVSYNIPLPAGVYELHLYFAEPSFGPGLGGGEGSRTFHVWINSHRVLTSFDIESDAMGLNIADERIFKDVAPASDGKLHVTLESESGKPLLNALEVVPAAPHKQNPIRLIAQANAYMDRAGESWEPDNYFMGGISVRKLPVTGTPDPDLFNGERYGHFTYAIPVDVRGRYKLTLYFAERYYGPGEPGGGGVGNRRFNVMCNGVLLLDDFDIFKEVGTFHALTKTFHQLKPSPQGKLNLLFEPIANYATVSAIEVVDESER